MVKVQRDLTGLVVGRLTVLRQVGDYIDSYGRHFSQWECECNCEEKTIINVIGTSLTRKKNPTSSCGCTRREKIIQNNKNKRKYNIYDLSNDYGIGFASNTGSIFYFDKEDLEIIEQYCWYENIDRHGYHSLRTRNPKDGKIITMHKLLGFSKNDHINRNALDNRKENLRNATTSQNRQNSSRRSDNTSGVVGVYFHSRQNEWVASIGFENKQHHIGYFINKEDAIKARLQAEVKYYGEFAPQKYLFEQYRIDTCHMSSSTTQNY